MKGKILFIIALIILCATALTITIDSIKEEPKLQPVVADVNILPVGPTAPTIVRFGNPSGILSGPYNPQLGVQTPTYISMLVKDINGNNELPGSLSYPITLNTPTSNILAGYYSPSTAPNPTMARLAISCLSIECASLLSGAGLLAGVTCDLGLETTERAYTCTINLGQTDPPGNWRFSTSVKDSTSLVSTIATSQDISGLYRETAIFNSLTAAYFGTLTTGGVSTLQNFLWTGLSSTGTNQISAPVTITNIGNIPSSNVITLTGKDLAGVNIPSSILSKTAFRVSTSTGGNPPSECSTGIQLSASAQTIPGATLPYTQAFSLGTGTDTEMLYACIPNTLISSITGALDTQYKTSTGQDWTVTI